jgi:hypothetical protein
MIGIGNYIGIGKRGSGVWTSPGQKLGGETPNFWVKEGTRNGLTLPDSVTPGAGDASLLLPYYYKPTGNEYAYVNDASKLDIGVTDLTLCGWANSEDNGKTAYKWIFGKSIGGDGFGTYCVFQDITTGYLRYRVYSSGTYVNVSTTVDFTTLGWAFLRLDINLATSKVRFFVNEVQQGTDQSFTGNFTPSGAVKFTVGCQAVGAYIGKSSHSDTYVYRRLLTPAEGATLMARGFVTGAEAHWPLNVEFSALGAIFYDVSGNGNHMATVAMASTKKVYGIQGSRYLLDKGYTYYYIAGQGSVYVGLSYAGTQLMGDTIVYGGYTFPKIKSQVGSLTNHNLADSLVIMAGAGWDRSDAGIYQATARAGYYDAANPKRWHPLELDQELIDSWMIAAKRDINFVKTSVDSVDSRNYLQELFSYSTAKAGSDLTKILTYTNDNPLPKDYLEVISTQSGAISQVALSLTVATSYKAFIDWGDGTAVVEATGSNIYTSNYVSTGTYHIKVYRDITFITGFGVSNTTLSGNLIDFNNLTALTLLKLTRGNWIGDIDAITCPLVDLTFAYITGIYGSINSLPTTLHTLILYGIDDTHLANYSGLLDNLPAGLTYLSLDHIIAGQITGNANNVPAGLATFYLADGGYVVTGNFANLPSSIVYFCVQGNGGTWVGDITDFDNVAMVYLSCSAMPNITGHIESMQASLQVLLFNGCPNVIYNGGAIPAWVLSGSGIGINNSWTTAMVDAFLIAAAAGLPHNTAGIHINLQFSGMGARTSASDAAMATLATNHYVVTTN